MSLPESTLTTKTIEGGVHIIVKGGAIVLVPEWDEEKQEFVNHPMRLVDDICVLVDNNFEAQK